MLQVLVAISQNFVTKEAWAMQKLLKKEEKNDEKKWTQKCLRYLKQWVLRCLPKKRKRDE